MWPGFMALGPGDPFVGTDYVELLVNNQRAYSYAARAGLTWLLDCLDCPEAGLVMPGGPEFISPSVDYAPWYDPTNPDTWGFLGVVGVEIVGADASTRQVTVTNTLQIGGVTGPAYFGPRTMVLRGLLVGEDECSLQAGLDWLGQQSVTTEDPCHGDALTFFDCCPCVCDDTDTSGPCWAETYDELTNGPVCANVVAPVPPYFQGGTGVFGPYTLNPPDLPDQCTWVFHVRGPTTGVAPVAGQWGAAGERSWKLERNMTGTTLRVTTSVNGTASSLVQNTTGVAGDDGTVDQLLAVTREVVGGQQRITSYISNAAGSWGQMGTSTLAANIDPFDTTATKPLWIGCTGTLGAGTPDAFFDGRIYSVQLHTGIDPTMLTGGATWDAALWDSTEWDSSSGQLLWRFDASEYPGFGTSYVDPRGRTWTVEEASIILPDTDPGDRGPVWWPLTYDELTSGPPADDPDWCAWPTTYDNLTTGPPAWGCCVTECVVPYLRQFYNTKITSGPTVLRQPVMSCGALMEFEMTIVAADPRKYAMPSPTLRMIIEPGEPYEEEMSASEAFDVVDPFAIPGVTTTRIAATRTIERPATRTSWTRTTVASSEPRHGNILPSALPLIVLAAMDGDLGEVRLGLWRDGQRLGGFWLPFIPAGSTLTLDSGLRRVIANVNGTERVLSGFVRDYGGGRVAWPELGHGTFDVTVDQEPERAGRLAVEVHAVDVGPS